MYRKENITIKRGKKCLISAFQVVWLLSEGDTAYLYPRKWTCQRIFGTLLVTAAALPQRFSFDRHIRPAIHSLLKQRTIQVPDSNTRSGFDSWKENVMQNKKKSHQFAEKPFMKSLIKKSPERSATFNCRFWVSMTSAQSRLCSKTEGRGSQWNKKSRWYEIALRIFIDSSPYL